MQIRTMMTRDLPATIALWRSCEGIGLSSSDSVEELSSFLARNPATSYVACADERVIGAVLAGHDGRRGFLYHLAVDEASRRQGLGRSLVTHALSALEAAGILKCHVMVYRDNAAGHAFWERIGWARREDIDIKSIAL